MGTVHSIRKGQARRAPSIENRKVTLSGGRAGKTNEELLRPREYLTPAKVERLMASAGKVGRHGHRDAALLLLAYRHALRVSELGGVAVACRGPQGWAAPRHQTQERSAVGTPAARS
jgi:hypothetical protein